jgi:hypothetical protein
MIASLLSEDNLWVNAQRIEVSGRPVYLAGSKGRNTAPHLPSLYAAVSRYSQGKIRHLPCFPAAAEELPPARTTSTKK